MPETRAMTRNEICEEILWKSTPGLTPYPEALAFMEARAKEIHQETSAPWSGWSSTRLSLQPAHPPKMPICIIRMDTRLTQPGVEVSGPTMGRDSASAMSCWT